MGAWGWTIGIRDKAVGLEMFLLFMWPVVLFSEGSVSCFSVYRQANVSHEW